MAVPEPRVGVTVPEQVEEPQLIVACPAEAVVESLKRHIPNYISKDEEEVPDHNTWSGKHIQRTINQESILSAMDITSSDTTAHKYAS